MSFGFDIRDQEGNLITGNKSILHYLTTINVAGGSGAGSQTVTGAKYAIATPDNIDAIAPRVDVDVSTGVVSWPSSAAKTNLADWILNNNITFNDPMTITVLGEGQTVGGYGIDLWNENGNPLIRPTQQSLALVAEGSGTPTIRADNTYRLNITTNFSTADDLLVFAKCTKYIGLGTIGLNSVEILAEDGTTVYYKIFAPVESIVNSSYLSGKYGMIVYNESGVPTFSAEEQYIVVDGEFQKSTSWIFRLTSTKTNTHGQNITVSLTDPYVCLNPMRGPTTSQISYPGFPTFPAYTTTGIKVNGTTVTVGMFTMYTTFTSTVNGTFTRTQFDNRFLLCT